MLSYDFTTLSPSDFEVLTRDLLQADKGWQLEAFATGPDGGVDLRTKADGKRIIVQCKHYARSSFSDLKKACQREREKMDDESPQEYLLVTSQDLTRDQRGNLVEILSPWLEDTLHIYSRLDLNDLLSRYPNIEKSHFKLWLASSEVLDRIINAGIWERSEALMEDIKDRIKLYAKSQSYDEAYQMLDEKKIVAITGSPGVGKSMLADMLCLVHWEAGWQIVNLPAHRTDEGWDAWRRDERQLFMFDDVFGQTDISEQLGRGSGATINQLLNRVSRDPRKRLVITTRTQILRLAEQRDENVDRAKLSERECVVQVSDYGPMSRARILYNHLYFSDLDRSVLRDFVEERAHVPVVNHRHFTPRVIEQIVLKQEHSSGSELKDRLLESLDNSALLWGPSFRESLSTLGRSVILQLATFPVAGAEPELLRARVCGGSEHVDPVEYTKALKSVEGTWVKTSGVEQTAAIVTSFHDPSCRDFVLSFLDSEPSYMGQVLARCGSFSELVTILSYALAKVTPNRTRDRLHDLLYPELKYPGLKRWVERNASSVAGAIVDRWFKEIDTGVDDYASHLAQVYDLNMQVDLQLDEFILSHTFQIGTTRFVRRRQSNGYACSKLLVNASNADRGPSEEEDREGVLRLFETWCLDTSDDSDWREIESYISDLRESTKYGGPFVDSMESTFLSSMRDWITGEIENVGYNSDSFDEVRQALREIGTFAKSYFDDAEIDREIEAELAEQDERYNREPSPEEMEALRLSTRAVSGDEDEAVRAPSVSAADLSENPVDRLFNQLR